MVKNLKRIGTLFFIVVGVCAEVDGSAQLQKPGSVPVAPEFAIRRVAVLLPARSTPATPQIQWRIEQERASSRKARAKSRRRSRKSKPMAAVPSAPMQDARAASGRPDNRVGLPNGNVAPRADIIPTQSAVSPGSGAPAAGKTDVVPPEQRAPLAQALLADALVDRLQDRLGLVVAGDTETAQALQALHLTPEQAMQPDNARRLCARLNCQAVLLPRVTACAIHEGVTRDVSVFADVRLAGTVGFGSNPAKPSNSAGGDETRKGQRSPFSVHAGREITSPDAVPALAGWPAQISTAGTAIADRVLFHKQYQKSQGDLIRDASLQAITLLAHALRVGEQAPFMHPSDRVAVTPVLIPASADELIFTAAGRRVVPAPLADNHTDISALFLPDLLPVASERIVGEEEVRAALAAQGLRESGLWADEDHPASARVQSLGRKLRAQYMLLTRVTDVELSASEVGGTIAAVNTLAVEQGRSARVEASGALMRVEDGALLWRDRVTATMTASPRTAAAPKSQSNQALTHDAIHFALVELQRRLRRYRSTFAK